MIIATAGHVDHGKTSLVRQLTGVETDTLAEEQERGLSINLGYAYLPRPGGGSLGFIDVPGHRRFINTMISGISGIDMGLLVVAADDGPMPQTLEHIDVLDILGVDRLAVAISKTDRVSPVRIEEVREQLQALLAHRRWEDVALYPVSNEDGSGVEALSNHLFKHEQQRQDTSECGFRLSVDRVFSARGAGTIVTGTASAGQVNQGDKLLLLPSRTEVRVRGLRAHDTEVDRAGGGQRVALNLSGKVDLAGIERGDWLVDANYAQCSTRLDVEFSLATNAPFPLKHLAPVKLYLGAKRVAGRLALVDGAEGRLQPGDGCLAQLILDRPVSATHGERFLLRDQAEEVILGGGRVLDPAGPKFGKSRPGRLAWLRALQANSAVGSLSRLLAGGQAIDLDRFWAIRNRPVPTGADQLPEDSRQFDHEGKRWAVSASRWSEAVESLAGFVGDWHAKNPELPGVRMTDLTSAMNRHFEPALAMAALVALLQAGELALREGYISLKGFERTEPARTRSHWQTLRQYLQGCGQQVPLRSELQEATQVPEDELEQVIKEAVRAGDLHRLNNNRYALPEQLLSFAERLLEADSQGEELSVASLKSHFQTGRKLTVELLEYFDSIHFTRRQGNARVVLDSAAGLARLSGGIDRKSDRPGGVPGLQNQ